MDAGRKDELVPRRRAGHRRGEVVAGRDDARLGGGEAGQSEGESEGDERGHAPAGSTSMRPFISMCIAWQNQEQ